MDPSSPGLPPPMSLSFSKEANIPFPSGSLIPSLYTFELPKPPKNYLQVITTEPEVQAPFGLEATSVEKISDSLTEVKPGRTTCKCKQSRCLKLYCSCFAEGLRCESCSCVDCHNSEAHSELVHTASEFVKIKNPLAFRSKFVKRKQDLLNTRGCNCSRSMCQKNYCECFQKKVGCSRICRCHNCKNMQLTLDDTEVRQLYQKPIRRRLNLPLRQRKQLDSQPEAS